MSYIYIIRVTTFTTFTKDNLLETSQKRAETSKINRKILKGTYRKQNWILVCIIASEHQFFYTYGNNLIPVSIPDISFLW